MTKPSAPPPPRPQLTTPTQMEASPIIPAPTTSVVPAPTNLRHTRACRGYLDASSTDHSAVRAEIAAAARGNDRRVD